MTFPGAEILPALTCPARPDACMAWGWCVAFAGPSRLGLIVFMPSQATDRRDSHSQWHLASLLKHLGHRSVQLINVLSAAHLPAG